MLRRKCLSAICDIERTSMWRFIQGYEGLGLRSQLSTGTGMAEMESLAFKHLEHIHKRPPMLPTLPTNQFLASLSNKPILMLRLPIQSRKIDS